MGLLYKLVGNTLEIDYDSVGMCEMFRSNISLFFSFLLHAFGIYL